MHSREDAEDVKVPELLEFAAANTWRSDVLVRDWQRKLAKLVSVSR